MNSDNLVKGDRTIYLTRSNFDIHGMISVKCPHCGKDERIPTIRFYSNGCSHCRKTISIDFIISDEEIRPITKHPRYNMHISRG